MLENLGLVFPMTNLNTGSDISVPKTREAGDKNFQSNLEIDNSDSENNDSDSGENDLVIPRMLRPVRKCRNSKALIYDAESGKESDEESDGESGE